jgi:hypothetical protein
VRHGLIIDHQGKLQKTGYYVTDRDNRRAYLPRYETYTEALASELAQLLDKSAAVINAKTLRTYDEYSLFAPSDLNEQGQIDPIYAWVCTTIFKITPEDALRDKSTNKRIWMLVSKPVNKEKFRLGLKALDREHREALAVRLADKRSGFIAYYEDVCPNCATPQKEVEFTKYILQWADQEKPGRSNGRPKPRPDCPDCHGEGLVTWKDEQDQWVSRECECAKVKADA